MLLLVSRARFLRVRSRTLDRTHGLCVRCHSISQLRQDSVTLMRKTAQQVSVITAKDPMASSTSEPTYRGATLSSFTTISMHPYPIVAFSLRKPSRMANLLLRTADKSAPHMVINLLSASQAQIALQFSRPHVYPDPFASLSYASSKEDIPILHGSLGALSCTLLNSWPLDDSPDSLITGNGETLEKPLAISPGEQGSDLFLVRVLRVEDGFCLENQELERTAPPLVYFHRQYVTVDATKPLLPLKLLDTSNHTPKS